MSAADQAAQPGQAQGTSNAEALLNALRSMLGDAAVLIPSGPDDITLTRYQTDWRGRYHGLALAIVRPASTDQVAATVRLCAQHGASIVPQGGHTGLVGGGVPDATGQQIVLSLQRLNRVLSVDAANLSMTVQAGCLLADVQQAADAAGLLFPLSLASEGSCTIGGNLASNAGGTQVLRYGTARELCLGLEAVTAQGEVWPGLKSLRKDNTGYDLRNLLIGSEGTLGIITAACLRLYPKPASQMAALVACDSLSACLALLARCRQQLGARLCGFELMQRYPIELTLRHMPDQAAAARQLISAMQGTGAVDTHDLDSATSSSPPAPPWTVLIDASSPGSATDLTCALEDLLVAALEAGEVQLACVAQSDSQYKAMWTLRESIPLAEKMEGQMVKHDIAVPTSRIPEFVAQAEAALQSAFVGSRIVCFGHLGDGNLHYNVQAPAGMSDRAFLQAHEHAVNQIVYDIALTLGGTLSAEHGIGQLKRDELAQRQSPVGNAWMRAIKQALDPAGTLNPNKLLS
jgi:FAD/FMN-containing dehydrogenase